MINLGVLFFCVESSANIVLKKCRTAIKFGCMCEETKKHRMFYKLSNKVEE